MMDCCALWKQGNREQAKMNDIFVISYHRPKALKTVKYYKRIGYDMQRIRVVIDDEGGDADEYKKACELFGCQLYMFSQAEARARYDFVHRPTKALRAAGMARNEIYDIAEKEGIDFYIVQDDDTTGYEKKVFGTYAGIAGIEGVDMAFKAVRELMERRRIGLFGIPQSGDFLRGFSDILLLRKVMNTTFILRKYIYRGERAVQDNDTTQFATVGAVGLFMGSTWDGLCLKQTPSAKQEGGLTDLYREAQLLNKGLVCVIQYPSAVMCERQISNGGRLHHTIYARYLYPCLIRNEGGRDNIAWDTYPEDVPFTLEPRFSRDENRQIVKD